MATKKKNKLLPMIIMTAVAVVLGVAWVVLDGMGLNVEPEPESTVVSIQSKSTDDLVSITFNDKNGDPMTLVKEENIWYVESDMVFPVDQEDIPDITATLGTLLATRTIEEDTGEFGFDDPQNVISATYEEDEGKVTVKYTIGDVSAYNSGTYVRDDVSGKIYLCSSNPAENFLLEKNDLIKLDIAAFDVEPTSTHTVTITGADGTVNVITDTDGIEEFLGDPFGNVNCDDWVEYDCDDADMAKYGITKVEGSHGILLNYKTTVSVTDSNGESTAKRQETTYNIWFGDTIEDGSVYYTITDSKFVYKLDKERYDLAMSYLTYTPSPETTDVTTAVTEGTTEAE